VSGASDQRSSTARALRDHLAGAAPFAETDVRPDGEVVVRVPPDKAVAAAEALAGFQPHPLNYLSCVSGVDRPDEDQIEVVYTVHSLPGPAKASLRVRVDRKAERPSLPSLVQVWPAADYHEREVYDLLGVWFEGHPDLRRILLAETFEGHPLRKDFVQNRPPRRRVTREDYQP